MILITAEQISSLAPKARPFYANAFLNGANVLAKYGINDNPLRLAHFMAQVLHESGALRITEESLNYTTIAQLRKIFSKRFPTDESAKPYLKNPEKLANFVYGKRKDLGNDKDGDGWRFIGRGLIQITGRDAYTRFGGILGADFLEDPTLAFSEQWCLPLAAEEWKEKKCNKLADADDVLAITKKINGGVNGLEERKTWLIRTKQVWPLSPVSAPAPQPHV